MTDSKHVLVAAVPAGAIYSAAVVWPRLRPAVRRFVLLAALGTLLAGGYQIAATFQRVVVEGVWQPVFALAWLNPKARLFTRTGEQFAKSSLATWIGYGPGAYASRAASIRATDLLFKEQTHLPGLIPPHTAPAYAAVMYDLYTSEIVETARYRSGVLTNPFSSAVGIVGEYGLVGTIVVLVFLIAAGRAGFRIWRRFDLNATWRAAGATAGFGIPFLGGLGFFDSYFEQPDVVVPLMVMLLLGVVAAEGSAVLDNPSPRQGFDRTA